jgi:hypothetical protein
MTFQYLRLHNPMVADIMQDGGTVEDCAVALAVCYDRLVDRLMTLEGIAPRRIRLPDGRVMVWRCPDHMIPETDMANAHALAEERSDDSQKRVVGGSECPG